jgi:hypothetical protein
VPLLPPNTVTNAGPPVSEHNQCYDHVLSRGVAPPGECCASAYAHVAMQPEQADAKALLAALDGCVLNTSMYGTMRASMREAVKQSIRDEVYDTWSDHWPVVAPLHIMHASSCDDAGAQSDARVDAGGQADIAGSSAAAAAAAAEASGEGARARARANAKARARAKARAKARA